jgi:two-component SAPR family response regulator
LKKVQGLFMGESTSLCAGAISGGLAGKRILIVEDEFFIALNLQRVLQEAGAWIVGSVPSVDDALDACDREDVDAAVLDVKLWEGSTLAVAAELRRRGIPFVFASAYSQDILPPPFRDRPYLMKPFRDGALVDALVRELT